MNKPRGMLMPRTDVRRQTFGSLFFEDNLAPTPATFGQQALISDWGVLGNLQWGDCMFAGMAHAVMYLNAQVGIAVPFTDAGVLADYGAVTFFNLRTSLTTWSLLPTDEMAMIDANGTVISAPSPPGDDGFSVSCSG